MHRDLKPGNIFYEEGYVKIGDYGLSKFIAQSAAGGNTASVMKSVLFPILTPAMLYAWIWIALLSYRELALPAILAGKDNTTVAVVVWGLWESGSLGQSAAMTVIILVCFTPLLMLYWYVARKVRVVDN